jgi:hypothetical protein
MSAEKERRSRDSVGRARPRSTNAGESPSAGNGESRDSELNTVRYLGTRYGTERDQGTLGRSHKQVTKSYSMGERKGRSSPSLRTAPRSGPARPSLFGQQVAEKVIMTPPVGPALALVEGATPRALHDLSFKGVARSSLVPVSRLLLSPRRLSLTVRHNHVSFATDHSSQWGLVRAAPWLVCLLSLLSLCGE